MEDNFYLDDFELSLKEQANQFKMTPSKKVWHGIYNDMHPGRRWPSITISLLLVISIVFVGYINTHHDKVLTGTQPQAPLANENNNYQGQTGSPGEKTVISEPGSNVGINSAKQRKYLASVSADNTEKRSIALQTETSNSISINHKSNAGTKAVANTLPSEITRVNAISPQVKKANYPLKNQATNFLQTSDMNSISTSQPEGDQIIANDLYVENLFEISGVGYSGGLSANPTVYPASNILVNKSLLVSSATATEINADKNSLLPSDKKQHLKAGRKQNGKMTWQFYAGAFVSSASFNGNHLTENPNQNSLSLPQVTPKDMKVIHNPALGYEAGIEMNYLFAKKLQLTAGVQFTRAGYNIISSEVHPTLTTLLLKDKATGAQYSRNFVTHYGDGNGQFTTTLHNYSYQASLPVGVQYQLLGNSKVQFNLGLNVEPSLTLKSNAYLLSSDGRNYVNVPDLYRKWNLNSSFTPFFTFKSDKFRWNLGPVLRYQWLSSYLDDYTRKEHLFDYGLRLGISK